MQQLNQPHINAQRRAVIFDVDGVLVDSSEAHFQSWIELARETNAHFTRDIFTQTFGRTSKDIINAFWPADVVRERGVHQLDDRKEALYRQIIASHVPIMPGAAPLIDALTEAKFALAVGSSGPPENVAMVLEALGKADHFAARITGKDVTRGKPDPQVFQLAAERLGIAPQCCLVIEDAPAGIDAAHAAGMPAIGFVSTGRSREELAHAERVVTALGAITPTIVAELIAKRSRTCDEAGNLT